MNLSMAVKTAGIRKAFLLCVFLYESQNRKTDRMPCHTGCRRIASRLMSFYMYPQVSSLGKSLFALRAAEGFLSCVNPTVCVQATGLGEGLVTRGAGEGLIFCVDSTVIDQVTRPGEGLVTGGAGKWLISCVCPQVTLQVTRHRERLATLST